MNESVVEVRSLRKAFGNTVAVNNISFDISAGEIVGLLGPNGAGKTTTIHMLLGLITPSSGSIRIFGKELQHCRVQTLRRMNFASAYQSLPGSLKVWENLFIFAEIYLVKNGRKKIQEFLDMFELSEYANLSTGKLSSGEQTRLNLCKALLTDPELLLLDEPTASLDPDFADKVRKILAQRHEITGMTVVNTSHNMIDVDELCDRILFLQHGEIIAAGEGHKILKQYDSETLEEVFIKIARNKPTKSITKES